MHSLDRQLEQGRIFFLNLSHKVCECIEGLLYQFEGVFSYIKNFLVSHDITIFGRRSEEANSTPHPTELSKCFFLNTINSYFLSWSQRCLQAHAINTAAKDAFIKPPLQCSFILQTWALLKETLNLHLNIDHSGVSRLRLKSIFISYERSAGSQQGYWG